MHSSGYRFPWRDGNRFDLLVDGPAYFSRMLQAIEQARREILLELYLFESGRNADRFIDVLARAAARGVAVRVLLDAWGARGLAPADRHRLAARGASLAFHNTLHYSKWTANLLRDHRKLLWVDGELGFVGGTGITDDFEPSTASGDPWHETMVLVRGPVLDDWHALFREEWSKAGGEPLPARDVADQGPVAGQRGRVVASGPLMRSDLSRSVYWRLRRSDRRVWLATPYFVPSGKLRRILKRAAHRGVDVRLLLPGDQTDLPGTRHAGRRFYASLLRQGVRIFEYQPSFIHAKVLLCDSWVSMGSSNLDRWNLRWNLEANQEVDDAEFGAQVEAMFLRDFDHSSEWDLERWIQRPWTSRCVEWFWGTIGIWLARLRHPGRY